MPLDEERVLDAAASLIEEQGLPAFSLRALGQALGVEAMSVYHYFPSKGHLFDALFDRVVNSITPADGALPWVDRVRAEARAYRQAIVARPSFALFVLTHRSNTRAGLAHINRLARLFLEGQVPEDLAARQLRTMGYYLSGAIIDETSGYARGPTAADPVPMAEQAQLAPDIIRLGPWFAPAHWEATFTMGLEALIREFVKQRDPFGQR